MRVILLIRGAPMSRKLCLRVGQISFVLAILFVAAYSGRADGQDIQPRTPLPHPPLNAPNIEIPPSPPAGLSLARPADCSANDVVKRAFGGDVAACWDRLAHRGVAVYWHPYREANCVDRPVLCRHIKGFRLYDARNGSRIAEAIGENAQALIIPNGALGDCYLLRAFRGAVESGNSNHLCITEVTDTQTIVLGPSTITQFRAIGHDNKDSYYCSERSWAKEWSGEPWGFVAGSRKKLILDPRSGWRGIHLQIMSQAIENPGTKPFDCPEGWSQTMRAALEFVVPQTLRQRMVAATFNAAFEPLGRWQRCFEYLWWPRFWFFAGAMGGSEFAGGWTFNGRILSVEPSPLALTIDPGQISLDVYSYPPFRSTGRISFALALRDFFPDNEITRLTLHRGHYIFKDEDDGCRIDDPHIEVKYLVTQTTPQPIIGDIRSQMEERGRARPPKEIVRPALDAPRAASSLAAQNQPKSMTSERPAISAALPPRLLSPVPNSTAPAGRVLVRLAPLRSPYQTGTVLLAWLDDDTHRGAIGAYEWTTSVEQLMHGVMLPASVTADRYGRYNLAVRLGPEHAGPVSKSVLVRIVRPGEPTGPGPVQMNQMKMMPRPHPRPQ
jgi:hypothetical protein